MILEEIKTLKNELKTLIQEAGKKVNLEVEKVKTMYKDKLHQTNMEIEFLRTVRIRIILLLLSL